MKLTKQQFIEKVLPNLPDDCHIVYEKSINQDVLLDGDNKPIFHNNVVYQKYLIQISEWLPRTEHEKKVFGE